MNALIAIFVVASICCCNAQNILVYCAGNQLYADYVAFELSIAGYPYKMIVNVPLTDDDFIGIDVFFETTIIHLPNPCPTIFVDSLNVIQNYLNSGLYYRYW